MDPVVEIHVGMTRRAVERCVTPRRPGSRVTGGIGFADVGFALDDDAAGADAATVVNENLADEIARHVERRAVVEGSREFHRTIFTAGH
jgi:hypothetical protein